MAMKNRAAVAARLQALANKQRAQFEAGLVKAGAYIQAQSQKIVPVDYGNLKASAFTRLDHPNAARIVVTIGYTAAYAIYVHEDIEGGPDRSDGHAHATHGAAFNLKHAAELAGAKALRKAGKGGTTGPYRHSRGENQQAKFLEVPFRRALSDGTVLRFIKAEMTP